MDVCKTQIQMFNNFNKFIGSSLGQWDCSSYDEESKYRSY
jgi:hypothetical protein